MLHRKNVLTSSLLASGVGLLLGALLPGTALRVLLGLGLLTAGLALRASC